MATGCGSAGNAGSREDCRGRVDSWLGMRDFLYLSIYIAEKGRVWKIKVRQKITQGRILRISFKVATAKRGEGV